ncbi:MFS transporter [Acidisphaera sp. L21]|uniref:MFS transporter n=1 Tax=Acidisphaera sp. L21 TaxID=1641851 RepID=UPI00131D2C7F|nr:MFS transporter [Acidisphaera sp. L21]
MSDQNAGAEIAASNDLYWRRNLWVCLFGSFSTVVSLTLLLPFLPLYVHQLGVSDPAAVVQWSGIAFGATFFSAAVVSPFWGHLADRYGRKLMLLRASLGMAIAMSMIGLAANIWQLVALRFLAGLLGGYASAAVVLIATQTPKDRSGWALGTLASGVMAGNLVGPLIGGLLPSLIGIRNTFFCAGALIFVAFLATAALVREAPLVPRERAAARGNWAAIPDRRPIVAMLLTGMLLMVANLSIEPIISVYVSELVERPDQVTFTSGLVMSATALGSILSASRLGKLADRIGHWRVLTICLLVAGVLILPQAVVTSAWQLIALRFLVGLSLGGLLPCVAAVIRHNVPDGIAGRTLGYSVSAQFAGQVVGPLLGGFVGGHLGLRAVFISTSALLVAGAAFNLRTNRTVERGRL